jgi:hypothetical protein
VGGFGAATPDLFRESTFILCETARTTTAVRTLAEQLVTYLRARPLFLPPLPTITSSPSPAICPYLVAATLMGTGAEMDEPLLVADQCDRVSGIRCASPAPTRK